MNVIHQELSSPRRRRNRQRRFERIVDAAMAIVAERGIGELTMTSLAAELDLSVGALYRYVRSKDALLAELQARSIEQLARRFDTARNAWLPSLPPDARTAALCELLATGELYRRLPDAEPRIFRLVSALLGDPRPLIADEDAARNVKPLGELLSRVATLFAEAAARGALGDGNALSRTIVYWSALHGVTSMAKMNRLAPKQPRSRGPFDVSALTHELSRALLSGWGAPTDDLARAGAWLETQRTSFDDGPPESKETRS
jgi:AcrR family transcriptional regulator